MKSWCYGRSSLCFWVLKLGSCGALCDERTKEDQSVIFADMDLKVR